MIAVYSVLRAAFGYLFLVFLTRIVGRRPGKQLTPFEFVLIFYLGGLTLTAMVGVERSFTNAVCQIFTIALCHYALTWLRMRSDTAMRILDGSPLFLLVNGRWRTHTLSQMLLQDDDVMSVAREEGITSQEEIGTAVLETFGDINVIPKEKESGSGEEREPAN